jgi:uncharacterized protein (DUF2336 family)
MLDRLISLSKDPSATGRRELLHAVTDLFLVEPEPNDAAKDDYSHIALQTLGHLGEGDRAAYAKRIAAENTMPRQVATKLANDPAAAVATVVLRLSPVLTDADLAAVAVTHSTQHLLAISQRTSISEKVTDILVQRGDRDVLQTVSGNDGAKLSDRGLSGLLERSAGDDRIFENLVRRTSQFTPEQGIRLQRIADQVTASAARDLAEATPFTVERKQAQERRLEVKLLVADIEKGRRSPSEVVEMLAADDRAFDLAQVVSAISGVPSVQCLKVLLDPESTGIAVACRSIGVSPEAFRAVLDLRAARLGRSGKQLDKEVAAYADLPAEIADRTLRFLSVRSKVG